MILGDPAVIRFFTLVSLKHCVGVKLSNKRQNKSLTLTLENDCICLTIKQSLSDTAFAVTLPHYMGHYAQSGFSQEGPTCAESGPDQTNAAWADGCGWHGKDFSLTGTTLSVCAPVGSSCLAFVWSVCDWHVSVDLKHVKNIWKAEQNEPFRQ